MLAKKLAGQAGDRDGGRIRRFRPKAQKQLRLTADAELPIEAAVITVDGGEREPKLPSDLLDGQAFEQQDTDFLFPGRKPEMIQHVCFGYGFFHFSKIAAFKFGGERGDVNPVVLAVKIKQIGHPGNADHKSHRWIDKN